VRVESIPAFIAALQRGLTATGPLLIDAATDPSFQPV
jgi:thiamine pyrophosphate-dependent acetolactate synthase large subunit-like protein